MTDTPATSSTAEIVHQPDGMQAIAALVAGGKMEASQLRELLNIQREYRADEAKQEFAIAMVEVQAALPVVVKDRENTHTHSRYAAPETIQLAIKPIYLEHGFTVTFAESDSPRDDWVRVEATVRHVSGHSETYHRDGPMDTKGPKGGDVKTGLQGCQSTVTYLSRNLLCSIFGVTVANQDIDGNSAGETIGEDAICKLREMCGDAATTEESIVKIFGVKSFDDLPKVNYAGAEHWLQLKIKGRS